MIRKRAAYTDLVKSLFQNARQKSYPKNQLVQYQGDDMADIHLIEAGYVKVYTILDSGDTRTLFILGPGDVFPIAFSTTMDWGNYKLKYFYQCLTDIRVLIMNSLDFRKTVESDTEKQNAYLAYMTASNSAIIGQLEAMKQKSAITRVIHIMPYLIRKMGQQIGPAVYQLKIKLTHRFYLFLPNKLPLPIMPGNYSLVFRQFDHDYHKRSLAIIT